jgi:hypothetical protein
VSRGVIPHLRVEKPHFLFLEGSTGTAGAAGIAAAVLPDASAVHAGASAARAGTSAARAASVMDCLATGAPAPAPSACSLASSAAHGEGDVGSHLSGRGHPFLLLLSRNGPAARRRVPAPAPCSLQDHPRLKGWHTTTRPRHRALGAQPSRGRPPSSRAPPPRARGLMWAGSPTDPIPAAGHRRPGSPPPPLEGCQQGRAPPLRGHSRAPRGLTHCRRRSLSHPRRPRRASLRGDDRVRPQHLGRREGGHGRRHPANT